MVNDLPQITIYTDGAAEPNPGAGGYGVVLISSDRCRSLSAGYRFTTNNRMELLAVIAGLEALNKPCRVTVFSDSKYVVDSMTRGSASRWRSQGWMRTQKHKAKNCDLWKRLLAVCERHEVAFQWVPGHRGILENEHCDKLATAAAKSANLLEDTGYTFEAPAPISSAVSPQAKAPSRDRALASGDLCRECSTPLVERKPKRKQRKPGQNYYFDWYLYCPGCKRMYMVEAAKRHFSEASPLLDTLA